MKFNAIKDKVCVLPETITSVSESGIVLMKARAEDPSRGTVVSVGSDVSSINTGDRVLFVKGVGFKAKLEGVEHIILTKEQVVGVIK